MENEKKKEWRQGRTNLGVSSINWPHKPRTSGNLNHDQDVG